MYILNRRLYEVLFIFSLIGASVEVTVKKCYIIIMCVPGTKTIHFKNVWKLCACLARKKFIRNTQLRRVLSGLLNASLYILRQIALSLVQFVKNGKFL